MHPLHQIHAAVLAGASGGGQEEPQDRSFITISREAGAQGVTLMHALLERLRKLDTDDPPWTGWHRELVERVAADHNLSASLVDRVADRDHGILSQVIAQGLLSDSPSHSDVAVYKRVASTIRGLAKAGRVIIVGRGGVMVTRDLPGGLHVRLYAPQAYRVGLYAERHGIEARDARRRIREIEHNRDAFYGRFFPDRAFSPERFNAVFNVEKTSVEAIADAIVAMKAGSKVQGPESRVQGPESNVGPMSNV